MLTCNDCCTKKSSVRICHGDLRIAVAHAKSGKGHKALLWKILKLNHLLLQIFNRSTQNLHGWLWRHIPDFVRKHLKRLCSGEVRVACTPWSLWFLRYEPRSNGTRQKHGCFWCHFFDDAASLENVPSEVFTFRNFFWRFQIPKNLSVKGMTDGTGFLYNNKLFLTINISKQLFANKLYTLISWFFSETWWVSAFIHVKSLTELP